MLTLQAAPTAQSADTPAEARQSQGAQQQQPAQQQQTPPPASGTSSTGSELFSIDRIRRELERQPRLTVAAPHPDLPVYRLRIEGYPFRLLTWQDYFAVPHSSVPGPIGGSDYYEMQRLITPPQAWGSAAFTNRDVLGMLMTQVETALTVALVKKAIEARRDAGPARAHAEVQQELAEIAAHNARVAAGQADDGTTSDAKAKAAAEKKKQDEAKKKKKKDDGGSSQ